MNRYYTQQRKKDTLEQKHQNKSEEQMHILTKISADSLEKILFVSTKQPVDSRFQQRVVSNIKQ